MGINQSPKISPTEIAVLENVKLGLSNKEIAQKLFVCEKTVKFHLTSIYKKMGVRSKFALLAKELKAAGADKTGLITDEIQA